MFGKRKRRELFGAGLATRFQATLFKQRKGKLPMNRKMQAKSVGQHRYIWPPIIQTLNEPGVPTHLRRRRYLTGAWFVQSYSNDRLKLAFQTDHFIDLPLDNIVEFRESATGYGNLILKTQFYIDGVNITSELLARAFGTGLFARRAPRRRRVSAFR
jgi:hypothetical protein